MRWAVDTFRKTGVRQWGLAGSGFCCVGGHTPRQCCDREGRPQSRSNLAQRYPSPPEGGSTATRRDRLRAAEADRAVPRRWQDPANYVIDQTAAVQSAGANRDDISTLIEAIPADLPAPRRRGWGRRAPAAWSRTTASSSRLPRGFATAPGSKCPRCLSPRPSRWGGAPCRAPGACCRTGDRRPEKTSGSVKTTCPRVRLGLEERLLKSRLHEAARCWSRPKSLWSPASWA